MPLKNLGPFFEYSIDGVSQSAFASAGATTELFVPFRGRIMEVGIQPLANSCTSLLAFTAVYGDNSSAIASSFNSTTGTLASTSFSSVNLIEGAVCSVQVSSIIFANRGDAIQFTTSGGQSGVMNARVYAIIRRQ